MLRFFFYCTSTTWSYTLSLHDALPIFSSDAEDGAVAESPAISSGSVKKVAGQDQAGRARVGLRKTRRDRDATAISPRQDRKSTRLNSSHRCISYAVFCLKKKTTTNIEK